MSSLRPKNLYCACCSKSFKSKTKLEEHEKSKKHAKNMETYEKRLQKKNENKSGIAPLTEDQLANRCLFCHHQSDCFENNLVHMKQAHSFFILGIGLNLR